MQGMPPCSLRSPVAAAAALWFTPSLVLVVRGFTFVRAIIANTVMVPLLALAPTAEKQNPRHLSLQYF